MHHKTKNNMLEVGYKLSDSLLEKVKKIKGIFKSPTNPNEWENIVLNRMRNNHQRESHSHVLGCCSRAATVTSGTHQFQYLSHEKNTAIKGTLSLFFFFSTLRAKVLMES